MANITFKTSVTVTDNNPRHGKTTMSNVFGLMIGTRGRVVFLDEGGNKISRWDANIYGTKLRHYGVPSGRKLKLTPTVTPA